MDDIGGGESAKSKGAAPSQLSETITKNTKGIASILTLRTTASFTSLTSHRWAFYLRRKGKTTSVRNPDRTPIEGQFYDFGTLALIPDLHFKFCARW